MLLPESLDRFVLDASPERNAIQTEMGDLADDESFPTLGPAAGAVLATLARARNAERAFEFGSGFGYSATWLLRGMAPEGTVVLTEIDDDELALAREFLAGHTERFDIRFEHGNAGDIIDEYDGPFDIVLIDHEKADYPTAFEQVAPKMAPGGVIVADNVMAGPVGYEDLLPYLEDDEGAPAGDRAGGLLAYLRTVGDHPGASTSILPVGSGLAVSAIDPERF